METTRGIDQSLSTLDEKLTILGNKIKDLENAVLFLGVLAASGSDKSRGRRAK